MALLPSHKSITYRRRSKIVRSLDTHNHLLTESCSEEEELEGASHTTSAHPNADTGVFIRLIRYVVTTLGAFFLRAS